MNQPLLFDTRTPTDRRFETWAASNEHVVKAIAQRAITLKRAGWKHYSVKALFEVARYHTSMHDTETQWKLNNNYTSRVARHIMENWPELKDFFEIRELKS